jgi:hypothetical protein
MGRDWAKKTNHMPSVVLSSGWSSVTNAQVLSQALGFS